MSPEHGGRSWRPRSGEGGRRPANDTRIAACALAYGLPLATLKNFEGFGEYEGLNLIVR
jgi:hypothetical protein